MSKVIGSGTYGVVIRVGRFAIKIISYDNFESAIREIAILRACDHPNIVKLTSTRSDKNNAFHLKMPLYACDLYTRMDAGLSVLHINNISRDLISAVDYIHSRGIIHCDINPKNILIDEYDNAVLCDLGIAVFDIERIHVSAVQAYMYRAPEIDCTIPYIAFSKHIDIWSVGCVIFELICGTPFHPPDGSVDTSIYVAGVMELPVYIDSSREARIQALDTLTPDYVRNRLNSVGSARSPKYLDTTYRNQVEIISRCLIPNIHTRATASDIVIGLRRTGVPIQFDPYDSDDMYCMTNVDIEIVSKLSIAACIYAENLYRMLIDIYPVTYMTQIACVCISMYMYSSINVIVPDCRAEIRKIIKLTNGIILDIKT